MKQVQQGTSNKETKYTGEDVRDIDEIQKTNPELRTAILLAGQSEDNLAVAGDNVAISRNLESSEGVTTVETQFNFKENHEQVILYDEVPKIFAVDAGNIKVDSGLGEYKVVKADPVFLFIFKNVSANTNVKVSYSVVEYMPANVLDTFFRPVLLYSKSEQPISQENPSGLSGLSVFSGENLKNSLNKYLKYWWVLAAIVVFVVLVILILKGRKKIDVKK